MEMSNKTKLLITESGPKQLYHSMNHSGYFRTTCKIHWYCLITRDFRWLAHIIPREMNKNVGEKTSPLWQCGKSVRKKKNFDLRHPHQKLLGSILGRDPPYAQVSSKFVQCFFFSVILMTNQPNKDIKHMRKIPCCLEVTGWLYN